MEREPGLDNFTLTNDQKSNWSTRRDYVLGGEGIRGGSRPYPDMVIEHSEKVLSKEKTPNNKPRYVRVKRRLIFTPDPVIPKTRPGRRDSWQLLPDLSIELIPSSDSLSQEEEESIPTGTTKSPCPSGRYSQQSGRLGTQGESLQERLALLPPSPPSRIQADPPVRTPVVPLVDWSRSRPPPPRQLPRTQHGRTQSDFKCGSGGPCERPCDVSDLLKSPSRRSPSPVPACCRGGAVAPQEKKPSCCREGAAAPPKAQAECCRGGGAPKPREELAPCCRGGGAPKPPDALPACCQGGAGREGASAMSRVRSAPVTLPPPVSASSSKPQLPDCCRPKRGRLWGGGPKIQDSPPTRVAPTPTPTQAQVPRVISIRLDRVPSSARNANGADLDDVSIGGLREVPPPGSRQLPPARSTPGPMLTGGGRGSGIPRNPTMSHQGPFSPPPGSRPGCQDVGQGPCWVLPMDSRGRTESPRAVLTGSAGSSRPPSTPQPAPFSKGPTLRSMPDDSFRSQPISRSGFQMSPAKGERSPFYYNESIQPMRSAQQTWPLEQTTYREDMYYPGQEMTVESMPSFVSPMNSPQPLSTARNFRSAPVQRTRVVMPPASSTIIEGGSPTMREDQFYRGINMDANMRSQINPYSPYAVPPNIRPVYTEYMASPKQSRLPVHPMYDPYFSTQEQASVQPPAVRRGRVPAWSESPARQGGARTAQHPQQQQYFTSPGWSSRSPSPASPHPDSWQQMKSTPAPCYMPAQQTPPRSQRTYASPPSSQRSFRGAPRPPPSAYAPPSRALRPRAKASSPQFGSSNTTSSQTPPCNVYYPCTDYKDALKASGAPGMDLSQPFVDLVRALPWDSVTGVRRVEEVFVTDPRGSHHEVVEITTASPTNRPPTAPTPSTPDVSMLKNPPDHTAPATVVSSTHKDPSIQAVPSPIKPGSPVSSTHKDPSIQAVPSPIKPASPVSSTHKDPSVQAVPSPTKPASAASSTHKDPSIQAVPSPIKPASPVSSAHKDPSVHSTLITTVTPTSPAPCLPSALCANADPCYPDTCAPSVQAVPSTQSEADSMHTAKSFNSSIASAHAATIPPAPETASTPVGPSDEGGDSGKCPDDGEKTCTCRGEAQDKPCLSRMRRLAGQQSAPADARAKGGEENAAPVEKAPRDLAGDAQQEMEVEGGCSALDSACTDANAKDACGSCGAQAKAVTKAVVPRQWETEVTGARPDPARETSPDDPKALATGYPPVHALPNQSPSLKTASSASLMPLTCANREDMNEYACSENPGPCKSCCSNLEKKKKIPVCRSCCKNYTDDEEALRKEEAAPSPPPPQGPPNPEVLPKMPASATLFDVVIKLAGM